MYLLFYNRIKKGFECRSFSSERATNTLLCGGQICLTKRRWTSLKIDSFTKGWILWKAEEIYHGCHQRSFASQIFPVLWQFKYTFKPDASWLCWSCFLKKKALFRWPQELCERYSKNWTSLLWRVKDFLNKTYSATAMFFDGRFCISLFNYSFE